MYVKCTSLPPRQEKLFCAPLLSREYLFLCTTGQKQPAIGLLSGCRLKFSTKLDRGSDKKNSEPAMTRRLASFLAVLLALPAAEPFAGRCAPRRMRRILAPTSCKLRREPPAPPTVRHGGGGGGHGDNLVLVSLDGADLRTLLSVGQWQHGGSLSGSTTSAAQLFHALDEPGSGRGGGSRVGGGGGTPPLVGGQETQELRLLQRMARWANTLDGFPRRFGSMLR